MWSNVTIGDILWFAASLVMNPKVNKMHDLSPEYILIIRRNSKDNWPCWQLLLFSVCIIPCQCNIWTRNIKEISHRRSILRLSSVSNGGLSIWFCDRCALISGIHWLELCYHSWCPVHISFPLTDLPTRVYRCNHPHSMERNLPIYITMMWSTLSAENKCIVSLRVLWSS